MVARSDGSPDDAADVVLLDIRNQIAHLTLNRPRVLNAINGAMRMRLTQALQELDQDPEVRVIVLGGAGRSFCAGNDLRESATAGTDIAEQRAEEYFALYDTVRRLTKPMIMRLHGHCTGAALQISLVADLRIAGASAKIGMTELNVGMPVVIGSSLLLAVVGEAVMKRLILLADFVSAEHALALNLVHEVVDDGVLDARIDEIAAGLATRSTGAIALTKAWWLQITDTLIDKTWQYARDNRAMLAAARSADIPARFRAPDGR
jgi:enoyl-CoA hydratase/carnithine racemase